MSRQIINEFIRFAFIVLFFYTGATKLLDHTVFLGQVAKSDILHPVAGLVAWSIPLIEIGVASMLIIPRFVLPGYYLSFALMVVFTLYVSVILLFARELPCSCGGVIERLGWTEHLVFNAALTGMAFHAMVTAGRTTPTYHGGSKP